MAKTAVIVVAAGKGERFGGTENKIFSKLDGRAVFLRSLEHFVNRDDVTQTILVVSQDDEQQVKEKFGPNLGLMGIQLVVGGAERTDSVANGLAAVNEDAELVAIHDAARPCLSEKLIDDIFAEAAKSGATIPANRLSGTLKKVSDAGIIEETVDRTDLWEAQTPQVFRRQVIQEAYQKREQIQGQITDDAQLVEATGHAVTIVEGPATNIKITEKSDLPLASAVLKSMPKPKPKGPLTPFDEAQW
jgi:2-C-methyl-D-erythritol 4-phosphate cytidylyltransferase